MKKSILSLLLIVLVAHLSACASSKKTQVDHYKDMQNETIYKAYKKVSIKAMKPVVKEYNKKLVEENKSQVGAAHVHALLGLIWVGTSQPKFALAEADYALTQASDPKDRYAALAIQAIAMHEQGWYHLAKLKSAEATALMHTHSFSNSYKNVLVLVHVTGATLAIMDYNVPHTISAVREAGVVLEEEWVVGMSDATQDAYNGATSQAVTKLENLANDPKLSGKERLGVNKVLDAAKKGGKDVKINMAKAAAEVALDTSIEKNSLTPLLINELPEKYRGKLAKFL